MAINEVAQYIYVIHYVVSEYCNSVKYRSKWNYIYVTKVNKNMYNSTYSNFQCNTLR